MIHKLRICGYGQILTVNLLINCKNSVIYGKMAVNYKEKSFMEKAPEDPSSNLSFGSFYKNMCGSLFRTYEKQRK